MTGKFSHRLPATKVNEVMQEVQNMRWDLTSIFTNESIKPFIENLQKELTAFKESIGHESLEKLLCLHQDVEAKLEEVSSYIHCRLAEDVNDWAAQQLQQLAAELNAEYLTAKVMFDKELLKLSDQAFEEFLKSSEAAPLAYILREKRTLAKLKLDAEQENLINTLAIDGFESWSELYHNTIGSLNMTCEIDGEKKHLNVAQAYNELHHSDPKVRHKVFDVWEGAFFEKRDLFASILNHLAGFRLKTYALRKWDSFLEEPLFMNRLTKQTLDAMWQAVDSKRPILANYLKNKAKQQGVDKLKWVDVEVPSYPEAREVSFSEAKDFIIDQFAKFGPRLAKYAQKAFGKNTIEAEDRSGKRPGGFCIPFPISQTSRIFMTYSNKRENLLTLAHELGHGFHNEVIFGMSPFVLRYPMSLAETASIFAEQLIFDGLLTASKSENERQAMQEERSIRSLMFMMNIRARFLFEEAFYKLRAKGLVSAENLSDLMVAAQKEAFGDSLSDYHPHFWISKQHFYLSGMPFYNFPYTFGYLFSLGLFALYKESKTSFEDKYCALLQDTGRMGVEELAQKHLNVRLETPEFWEKATNLAVG